MEDGGKIMADACYQTRDERFPPKRPELPVTFTLCANRVHQPRPT